MPALVAIPSVRPGGLDAKRSAHFGACDVFTLVSIEAGQVRDVKTIANVQEQGVDCEAPVDVLLKQKVDTLLVNNLGREPFHALLGAGVKVYLGEGLVVREAVHKFMNGELSTLTEEYVCDGQEHPC